MISHVTVWRRANRRFALLAGFGVSVAAASSSGQTYSIEDLGTLTNRSSVGMAASTTGYVAGFSTISGNNNGEPWFNHAFRWYAGVMSDLGVLGPDVPPATFPKPESQALGVNSAGQVVGKSAQPSQPYQGFLWLPAPAYGFSAGMNTLPELPGGSTIAADINDAGWIVGESRYSGSIGARPVLWQFDGSQWTIMDLGDLGGPYGRAQAINELGQICGQANAPSGTMRTFLWLPTPAYGLPAGMNDVAPGYDFANAFDLNDHGEIVGVVGAGGAFIWLPSPAYGLPAGTSFFNLGDVTDASSAWPYGINNSGVVVGQVVKRVFIGPPLNRYVNVNRAMIWQNGVMHDLNDFLPPNSGWTLIEADDVTPSGQIVGFGVSPNSVDSNGHAFRMSPVRPADMNCDGVVDAGDVQGFVLALLDAAGYAAMFPACNRMNADVNMDGAVSGADVGGFVARLLGP